MNPSVGILAMTYLKYYLYSLVIEKEKVHFHTIILKGNTQRFSCFRTADVSIMKIKKNEEHISIPISRFPFISPSLTGASLFHSSRALFSLHDAFRRGDDVCAKRNCSRVIRSCSPSEQSNGSRKSSDINMPRFPL